MSPRSIIATLVLCAPLAVSANCDGGLLDVDARRLLGQQENLCEAYGGKVLLVVNTASQCGFAGQFEGLQALNERYADEGLVVLGFPSDDFGGQEYDEAEKTAEYCKVNYGVSFPMFARTDVAGDDATPLFAQLAAATDSPPRWNFHKYLIGRDGQPIAAYGSRTEPQDEALVSAIETALAAQ